MLLLVGRRARRLERYEGFPFACVCVSVCVEIAAFLPPTVLMCEVECGVAGRLFILELLIRARLVVVVVHIEKTMCVTTHSIDA